MPDIFCRLVRPIAVRAVRYNSSVWQLGQLTHVGIAVPDLDRATSFFKQAMVADVTEKKDLPDHGVKAGMKTFFWRF